MSGWSGFNLDVDVDVDDDEQYYVDEINRAINAYVNYLKAKASEGDNE